MRILLPPSEAKAPRGRGRSLAVRGLEGALAEPRRRVLEALSAWCASDPEAMIAAFGLPTSTAAEDLKANARLLTAPTMPAIDRFRGVVFDGLDAASLSTAERRVALRSLYIASGAFGLLAAAEPVPDHRVPMAAAVPGVGGLTPFWRDQLAGVVPAWVRARQLVVDLRSSDYQSTPPVPAPLRSKVLAVRVVTERVVDGVAARSVVSYSSKLTKGQLTRALIAAEAGGRRLRTAYDVVETAAAAGFVVEQGLADNGQPTLEVVLTG
jgi:hypothetical protein